MRLVPVITVKDNAPVRYVNGKPVPWETPYPDGGADLVGLLRHLYVRFGAVCIEDAGQGKAKDAHHGLYQKLSKQQVEVWVDGHAETLEDIMDHFVAGADTVIVRMHTIRDDDLEDALELVDGNLLIGYGAHDENHLIEGLHERPPGRSLHDGAEGIYLVNASGNIDGFNPAWLRHLPSDVPLHVRTELSSPSMVDALFDAGAETVLIGHSIYDDLDGYAAIAKRLRQEAAADDDDDDDDKKAPQHPERHQITAREQDLVPGIAGAAATVSHMAYIDDDDDVDIDPLEPTDDA